MPFTASLTDMNLLKKSLLSFFFLVIITLIVLWALTKSIKPEAIKDIINHQLLTLTSQKSRINGDISWQLFPRPGIKINNIQIGDENATDIYSISIDDLLFNVQIPPLLRGKLVFNELKIDGFKIRINPAAPASTPVTVSKVSVQTITSKKSTAYSSAQFVIDSVLLTHGQISIVGVPEQILLSGLQIGASQLNLKNQFFPIQLKGDLSASTPTQTLTANINFKGRTQMTRQIFSNLVSALHNSTTEGQFQVQDLQINKLKIDKINANVKTDAEELILNPLNTSLYNGESVGDLRFNFTSGKLAINQTATGIDASPLFKALLTKPLMKGSLDFSVHASTNLHDHGWQTNFRGNGGITVKDGVLYFVDIHKLITDITQKTHLLVEENLGSKVVLQLGENLPVAYQRGKTKFHLISVQYRIQQAMLIDDSLLLQTDELQLKGQGQINLLDFTINNELSAKLLNADKIIEDIQKYLDGSLPFKLLGQLSNPQILPDAQKITPLLSQYLVKKTFAKPVKQLKTTLKKLFDELS